VEMTVALNIGHGVNDGFDRPLAPRASSWFRQGTKNTSQCCKIATQFGSER
jgi:hypothetical protein